MALGGSALMADQLTNERVPVTAGRLVGSTTSLELRLHDGTGQIDVRDRRTGRVFRSSPGLSAYGAELPEVLQAALLSTLQIVYTDDERRETYNLYGMSQERRQHNAEVPELRFTVTPWDNGVMLHYELRDEVQITDFTTITKQGTLRWSVGYRVRDDYLEVTVPGDSLQEEGAFRFVSLRLLPFFGVDSETASGGAVLPLGNGVWVPNHNVSPQQRIHFSIPVHGEDEFDFASRRELLTTLLPEELESHVQHTEVRPPTAGMPVFGHIAGDRSWMGIITAGASDTRIIAGKRGWIFDYNRTNPDFVYRKIYKSYMSRSRLVLAYEQQLIRGDHSIRYSFFPRSGAGYVDVAARYRRHLLGSGIVEPRGTPLMDLRVFCGVQKQGLLTREKVVATTFSEAQEMLATLAAEGITRVRLTLVGWESGGYYGSQPRRWPPERRLGGERGLRRLVEFAHSLGVPVYLEADYTIARQGNRGFSRANDVIKEEFDIPVTDGAGTYLLNPRIAYERFAREEMTRFAELGIDGLVFNSLAEVLVSDHDQDNRLMREEAARYLARILDEGRRAGLEVGAVGRNSYAYPYVSSFHRLPAFDVRLLRARQEVPLFAIAFHGLIPYYSEPLNLSDDLDRDLLRLVEVGMLPAFELTYRDPVILRDTAYNGLFSSAFRRWLPQVKHVYQATIEGLADVHRRPIVDHRRLAPEVYLTSFEGGARVIVNYRKSPYTGENVTVPPVSYRVLESR